MITLESEHEFIAWDRFASAALIAQGPMSGAIHDGADILIIEHFWKDAGAVADRMILERRKRLDPKFL